MTTTQYRTFSNGHLTAVATATSLRTRALAAAVKAVNEVGDNELVANLAGQFREYAETLDEQTAEMARRNLDVSGLARA